MAQGSVAVNNLNLAQDGTPDIERKVLFIGEGGANQGSVLTVNTQSNLDEVLGSSDTELRRNVEAARVNGGEQWQAFVAPQTAGYNLSDVIDEAMNFCSPELIAICTPISTSAAVNDLQAKAEEIRTTMARRVIMLMASPGVIPTPGTGQSWGDYVIAQADLCSGVAAYRCAVIPQLHGNDLGVLAGRLCNVKVSIADSPMRVATGPLLGLGATPLDNTGAELDSGTLSALDMARLSVPQSYTDFPGVYWGDCNLLDVPAGDYQVIENLRVIDKAARAIYFLAINKVADRSFNNTPSSIASHETFFTRPLREMSHSTEFSGLVFPGDIKPPKDDAILITWPTRSSVEVYLKVQPYNSPKSITANVILDLSGES